MLPGPKFASGQLFWLGLDGRPSLASFASPESSQHFRAIGQQPGDLLWLRERIEYWVTFPSFIEFKNYIEKKAVVNDCAER